MQKLEELNRILRERAGEDTKLYMEYNSSGLALTDGKLCLQGDLTHMLPRLKQSNLEHEILVKAVRIKNFEGRLSVLDATCGMGEDSILLAGAGFTVDCYEYDPIIGALLEDALKQAAELPELSGIVSRMRLHREDSIAAMLKLADENGTGQNRENLVEEKQSGDRTEDYEQDIPDVILLDPMFPKRSKSGLIKKKFQLLQQLEQPCDNEKELLEAALRVGARKIVIKRPAKGPFLADLKPSYSVEGKAIRYDCIINP